MFGSIGGPELVVIFIVALLIFGPRKLPELGRMVGKSLAEFRRAANDLRDSLETEVAREPARLERTGVGPAPVAAPSPDPGAVATETAIAVRPADMAEVAPGTSTGTDGGEAVREPRA
jgi:TatA/E family protein of Tat protein translocase